MKASNVKMYALLLALCGHVSLMAQSNLNTANNEISGENFSLEGAIEMFKAAKSIEDFEQKLNSENNHINNLDLNEDGQIDYIRVMDKVEDDVHALVLQVPVSEVESQDIAVIEIEKTGKENAILQIVGDETLYGENHFVEPYEIESEGGGKGGPSVDMELRRVVVNVWLWPSVRWIYRPVYRPYVSPWRWRTYPRWWTPWRPVSLSVFRPRVVRYRPACRVVSTHRVVKAHRVYTPHRKTSKVVVSRTVVHRNQKTAAKKTTTKIAKTNNGKVAAKKTTTKVGKTKNGKAAAKKTTTTVARNKKGNKVAGKKTTTVKKRTKNGAVGKKKTTTVRGKKRRN